MRFEKVDKRYGAVYALRNLTLAIAPGECVALAGRNGSGKTTLLRVASCLTRPTRGTLSFSGVTENQNPTAGFVAHASMVYDELTAEENLLFFAKLLGVADRRERVDKLLCEVGLAQRKDSLVRTFSRGMRQRIAIARALLADPALLLFDEPATGLDPEATIWLSGHLAKLRDSGCTIVMSLHGESEMARLATRAVRLDAGSVVSDTRSGASFQSVFSFAGG
ncbi:MAG TPA: ABC transporter ATP-binding protein [Candidatus Bathyarchaeia archaeon]|nr:ABC transporter ATP-binding protein [Candidatus Bathyarchaeia archaeon]